MVATDPHLHDEPAAPGQLRRNALGVGNIVFLVVSAAAPLTVVAGTVPLAILLAGGAAPTAYLVVGIALAIFAIGFMGMTRHVTKTGGFYAYIAEALGRRIGLGAGILALVSYNAMQIGIYGLFAVNVTAMLTNLFDVHIPWGLSVLVAIIAVWAMGFSGIDLGARILGVLLIAETLALGVIAVIILVDGGFTRGPGLGMFSPDNIFSPGFAVTLGLAFGAFIGFESTALYRAESRQPNTTIPRATYIALAAMTVFYFVIVWVFIRAYGVDVIRGVIGKAGVSTFVFATADSKVGRWAMVLLLLLIVTSVFAALLAFHNSINRYTYALARDGVLPAGLGITRRRNGAPWAAGLAQTILAATVTGGFALAHADPYLQLLIWVNTPGTIGIIVLQILTAMAVAVFFRRNPSLVRHRAVVPAAILGGALMIVFTILIVANLHVLTGASTLVNVVIVAVVPAAFVVGVLLAVVLRKRRPQVFARIGSEEA